jgi:integrase
MPKSTSSHRRTKDPAGKPHRDFPLTKHPRGYWCKKVRGKLHYFGKVVADPDGEAALAEWLRVKDYLLAGKIPPRTGDGLTVADLANHFLTAKSRLRDSDEITNRTFSEYRGTTDRLVRVFGRNRLVDDLAADDFERLRVDITKTWGVHRLANEVQRVRSVFKYGIDAGLIEKAIRYGNTFKKPSRRVFRVERANKAPRMFESSEVRRLIDAAGVHLKAMILLGVNCGFGNHDCERLPIAAVDLTAGWIDFPRPKTGIPRRVPLSAETVEALKTSLGQRPTPKTDEAAKYVFITKYGDGWGNEKTTGAVAHEFRKLLDSLKLHKPGRGFYSLRHVFETIGGDSRDQVAVDAIMGHARDDMASVYRERVADDRLLAVVAHVRNWLFGDVAGERDGVDVAHQQASGKSAPPDAQLAGAIARARAAIESATGPTRRTLESVWASEIDLALTGESGARARILQVWGDDHVDRPQLRVVNGE